MPISVHSMSRIMGVAVLCGLLVPTASATLLLNGGFEDGTNDWTGFTGGNAYVTDYDNMLTAHGGTYFSRIIANGWSLTQSGISGLSVGNSFSLSGYCASDGYDYGEATLKFLDASDSVLDSASVNNLKGAKNEWVPFSVDLDVPAGTAKWEVALTARFGGGSYIDVYWDDITLVPEPATLGLLALGGLPIWIGRGKR